MAREQSSTPRSTRTSKAGDVSGFLAQLEHPRKPEIEALRVLIRNTDDRVREEVKWNAPSFFIREHFATFKLRPVETVQLVLHAGAKVGPDAQAVEIDDPAGILKWAAKDRALATFADMRDVDAKGAAFASVLRQWIAHLDGIAGQPG